MRRTGSVEVPFCSRERGARGGRRVCGTHRCALPAWRWMGLLLLLSVGFCGRGWGQDGAQRPVRDPRNVDAMALGAPVDLGKQWLARAGDDPQWAAPGLDDSQWRVMDTEKTLRQQDFRIADTIWYRMHVRLPAGAHDLALSIRGFGGNDRVYVNGDLAGAIGKPGEELRYINEQYIPIPNAAVAGGRDLTIAIRGELGAVAEISGSVAGLGSGSSVELGPAGMLTELATLHRFRSFTSNAANLTMTGLLLLIAVMLGLTSRSEREYVALIVMLLAWLCREGDAIWTQIHSSAVTLGLSVVLAVVASIYAIALMEFVRLVLGLRRTRLLTTYYFVLAGFNVLANIVVVFSSSLSSFGRLVVVIEVAGQIVSLPVSAGLPLVALWVFWRRRNRDALLLFFPLLIESSVRYWSFAIFVLGQLHLIQSDQFPNVPIRGFYVGWQEVADFLFFVTLLIFLVLRTVRIARERAAAATEMQAVKTLQGLLLARASQATPGYAVETVYRPAQEVGGDFFLVSPGPDGAIVAIVGDVSGKGLLAAMRVSLILGALNRETSRTPAEVLNRLNQVLLGQGDVGFTTACCVRVEANGDFSFANAGHLNPYVDGHEMESPGALPLGIQAEQMYATVTGHLGAGQRMVLLSDGVPEARSRRELLGFEKLVELTRLRAAEIADAAQEFGQEDDITVLALALA